MLQTIQISHEAIKVIANVQKAVLSTPNGVSFCSIKNYTNQEGEVSDYVFNVGVSYENAVKKDIQFLNDLDVTTMEWQSAMVDIIKAKQELISSLEAPSKARSEGQKDAYTYINECVKIHNETGLIYISGMKVSKKVKEAVDYGEDRRKPLTKAKDEIRKLMKSTKYRNFIFSPSGMSIKISGEEIIFEKPTE